MSEEITKMRGQGRSWQVGSGRKPEDFGMAYDQDENHAPISRT
jgi:hypothetical protein